MSLYLSARATELGCEYITDDGAKVAEAVYKGFQHWELRFEPSYCMAGTSVMLGNGLATLEACEYMTLAVYAHCRALQGMQRR